LNGRPPVPRGTRRPISYLTIGPRYFATFARRPVRGREFTDTDGEGVALVNERFAALYFPAVDPVGHQITLSAAQPGQADDRVTIVGVAPNVRQRSTADRDFDPVVYVPQTSPALPFASMMARSTAGPERAISELRDAMRALDADVPLYDVRSLDGLLEDDRWEARMLSTMFGLFAALALTLAAVGVYAVTAFAVSKRTREIGVRIALGARAHHICLLVTGGAAMQIAIGTALGVAATLAAAPVLAGLLSEIDATDGVTLAAVPLLLGSIAMIACLVPAGRAVRVDPMAALRSE